jgi:hypothetical protein
LSLNHDLPVMKTSVQFTRFAADTVTYQERYSKPVQTQKMFSQSTQLGGRSAGLVVLYYFGPAGTGITLRDSFS